MTPGYTNLFQLDDIHTYIHKCIKFLHLSTEIDLVIRFIFERNTVILGGHLVNNIFSESQSEIPVTITIATVNDIQELSTLAHRNPEDFRKWIENRYVFIVAKINGKIVSYGCFCPASESRDPYTKFVNLRDDDAWALHCFTNPEYRRMKIYSLVLFQCIKLLKERGFMRVYGYTAIDNEASKKAHNISGLKDYKIINYTRIFGFKIYREQKGTKGEQ